MSVHLLPIVGFVAVAMLFSGCETPGEGAKHGALIGAGIGALSERSIEGAAAGAAIGAGTGALLGFLNARDRGAYYDGDRYLDEPGHYDDDGVYYPHRGEYSRHHSLPYGRRTGRSGYVRSPYRPHPPIDVRGIPRGAKVLDPQSERVFINP
jgi:hypothetical protein